MKKTTNARLAVAAIAVAALPTLAGIKYWDNPDYRAFDVDCYVPGAVWNLDGIRNVGAAADHDPTALTWKNLGSSGAANTTPAQRPSNPVRSCSRTSTAHVPTVTVPPSSHAHSVCDAPNVLSSGLPLTSTVKRPGAPSAQLRLRTQTRYVPDDGKITVARASTTGRPMPCASK